MDLILCTSTYAIVIFFYMTQQEFYLFGYPGSINVE